jgi:hypothetical protein
MLDRIEANGPSFDPADVPIVNVARTARRGVRGHPLDNSSCIQTAVIGPKSFRAVLLVAEGHCCFARCNAVVIPKTVLPCCGACRSDQIKRARYDKNNLRRNRLFLRGG